jgi:hypothetical protein
VHIQPRSAIRIQCLQAHASCLRQRWVDGNVARSTARALRSPYGALSLGDRVCTSDGRAICALARVMPSNTLGVYVGRRSGGRIGVSDPLPKGQTMSISTRSTTVTRIAALLVGGIVLALAAAATGFGSTTAAPTQTRTLGAVSVAVTAPTSGSVIAGNSVTIRGTVSPANATVQIQGQPAAVGNGVFTGTATLHGGKTTIDVIASAAGATPESTSITISQLSTAPPTAQSSPVPYGSAPARGATPGIAYETPASTGSNETPCGSGLAVGPHTTCAFAENVRSSYEANGPGTAVVYSPVTQQTYEMTCLTGTPVVCTGGNGASVYFP